ncbi:MAG: DUF2934 domain-containing protein [candidate division Zixibacteria bacterium]|nr:DUF2934 domain-containing protein [candidate division Zixibacteria bacterium]
MVKEINKTGWAKFCKEFSATNQYRQANVSIVDKKQKENGLVNNLSFMGLGLAKKGRLISGLELFAGRWDPAKITEPVLSIKEPAKVMLETDDKGNDRRLRVLTKDGIEARIELYGEKHPWQSRVLVEKVAYSLYERRGYTPGNDRGDWYKAEKIVKEAERQFAK